MAAEHSVDSSQPWGACKVANNKGESRDQVLDKLSQEYYDGTGID